MLSLQKYPCIRGNSPGSSTGGHASRQRRHRRPAASPPWIRGRPPGGLGDHHRAVGLRGRGFPVRRAFAGVDLAALDPFVHMDQMGEVDYAPGEPRAPLASPPRVRDRHLHDRRGLPAPGLQRRRRPHHRRRHPVDDRGRRILRIEAPPEEVVVRGGLFHGFQLWVNLPARLKMTHRATRTSAVARSRSCSARPTAAPWCRSSPARSPQWPGRLHPDLAAAPPWPWGRAPAAWRGRLQRPGVRPGRVGDGRDQAP